MACASTPRGPTDAEVRAALDAQLQQLVRDVLAGNTASVLAQFASDAVMVLRGVIGPEGEVINVELTGTDQIGSFTNQTGPPPDFAMQVTGFTRSGTEAEQTGRWSLAGEQTGTFTVTWRDTAEGAWEIVRWRFEGT
jgi:hypothetical protein